MTSALEQLMLKQVEFQRLLTKRLGMTDLKDLRPANLRRTEELAEKYLDIWKEADAEGDPLTRVDDAFNTLAHEVHELKIKTDRRHPLLFTRHPLLLRGQPRRKRPTPNPLNGGEETPRSLLSRTPSSSTPYRSKTNSRIPHATTAKIEPTTN